MLFLEVLDENGRRLLAGLYYQYRFLMFNAAFDILKDDKLAEDAVHNAFESVAEHLYIFGDVKSVKSKAYLLITVKNAAKKIYNKRKPLLAAIDIYDSEYKISDDKSPEKEFCDKLTKQQIYKALYEMEDKYRDVLVLKYYEGVSDKVIADILGLSCSAVRKRLERARKDLIKRYRGDKCEG